MLAETDFKRAIREHTPDLMTELEATAEAAGVAADDLFALQLLDEEWAYRVRRSAARSPQKCSSLAIVDASGPTWIAQNMDLGAYTDGFQALLEIDDGEAPAALVFTAAGMIGLIGVNAAGVGVCVNSLPQLPSAPQGLPVAFVLRRLLQARLGGGGVAARPDAAARHQPALRDRRPWRGALVRGQRRRRDGVSAARPGPRAAHQPSRLPTPRPRPSRRRRARTRSRAFSRCRPGSATADRASPEIQAALSSCDDPRHPVCRTGGPVGFTTGSMISALTPDGVEVWVSNGPPATAGYHHRVLTRASEPA